MMQVLTLEQCSFHHGLVVIYRGLDNPHLKIYRYVVRNQLYNKDSKNKRTSGFHGSCQQSAGEGVGLRGCGAFSLLQPDSSFRHVYLERNCYYPLRNDRYIQCHKLQLVSWCW